MIFWENSGDNHGKSIDNLFRTQDQKSGVRGQRHIAMMVNLLASIICCDSNFEYLPSNYQVHILNFRLNCISIITNLTFQTVEQFFLFINSFTNKHRISSFSFRGNYSFSNITLCTVIFSNITYRCGNYSRAETI